MRLRMRSTWYSGGVPEYQAGKTYDIEQSAAERLVRRGVAEIVPEPSVDVTPPVKTEPSKPVRRARKRK